MSRITLFALAFTSVLTAGAIAPALAADAPAANHQGGMRGFLSPQQRAMLRLENPGQYQSMSEEDRHAAREKMRASWMAMSESDREKKRAGLQAKWDALPQAQKDEINTKIKEREARHAQNGGA